MRLIDADKLIQELEKNKVIYLDEYEEGRNTGISWCIEDVVDAPTVKAIPIEWIEKWFSQFYGEQGLEWNRCKRFMLEDWEKENETN